MQRVGAYEVLYELSSGGMGSVLLGRRRGPGGFEKLVAIKTIRAALAAAPQVRAMFLDEAALLARLAHPAVAHVHDFGEEGKNLYLVMEYVAGVSLHVVNELSPPPHIAARLIADACRGLHAAHELRDLQGSQLGVVHRDISPDNLLLGFDGHIKVIDFGIALIKNRQAPVTEMGMLKGKPPYMSPEQIKNEPIDRRSDVFALGAVLWEMLVGEPLFSGDSIYAIARAVEHQEIELPSRRVDGLPPGLDAIAMAALQRDKAARLPTAAAMAARLDEVVAAVGGESLEEWSERVLAPQREAHRRWLSEVLGGGGAATPRMGRATGSVTALAAAPGDGTSGGGGGGMSAAADGGGAGGGGGGTDVRGAASADTSSSSAAAKKDVTAAAVAATAVAVVTRGADGRLAQSAAGVAVETSAGRAGETSARRAGGTSAGVSLDDEEAAEAAAEGSAGGAAARPRTPWILGAALLVAAALVGGYVLRQPAQRAAAEVDAGVDAWPVIAVVPRAEVDAALEEAGDAAVMVRVTKDAPRPRDAREAEPGRRDARVRTPVTPVPPVTRGKDAAPATPAPRPAPEDASVERTVAVEGPPGKLRAVAEPYAVVIVDGKTIGPTPLLGHPLPAGRHVVTLVDPVTGEVRVRKTVEVPAGGMVRVSSP